MTESQVAVCPPERLSDVIKQNEYFAINFVLFELVRCN